MTTEVIQLVRNFQTSLRMEINDPYESVKTCFKMFTVLPGSRRAALDHLSIVFLHKEFALTHDQQNQLMDVIDDISLKDWFRILGDWCCHVLIRSRYESPNSAFIVQILIRAFKAGSESTIKDVEWLYASLLNNQFSSRNIFSDLMRRLVTNFAKDFAAGLISYALKLNQKQHFGQQIVFALGNVLDCLGHGFPNELNSIVDDLLSQGQSSIQLLMEVSQTYPIISASCQTRIAERLSNNQDLKALHVILNIEQQTTHPGTAEIARRCIFNTNSQYSWNYLFHAVVSSYCDSQHFPIFAKFFLEELANNMKAEQLFLYFNGMSESDLDFLLGKCAQLSSQVTDFTLLSTITISALLSTPRPAKLLASQMIWKFHDKEPELLGIHALYFIAATRKLSLAKDFSNALVDVVEDAEMASDKMKALKVIRQVLNAEKRNSKTSATQFSISTYLPDRIPNLLVNLADFEEDEKLLHELVVFISECCPQWHDRCEYSENSGVELVLMISNMLKKPQIAISKVIFSTVEHLMYILLNFVSKWPSCNLLLFEVFVKNCFDAPVMFASSKISQQFFFQTCKILFRLSPSCKGQQFSKAVVWKNATETIDQTTMAFVAKILLQMISPDRIHWVMSSPTVDWPLDNAIANNNAVPVDFREYCLKIRNLVTVTCPFLLDFLSFFLSLCSVCDVKQSPVLILLPIFRALLYAAIACTTASTKLSALSLSNQRFVIRILSLLHQAKLLQSPLHLLPSVIEHFEPSQLLIVLRSAWPDLINIREKPESRVNTLGPILTVMKSKVDVFADIIPLFEIQTN